MSKTESTMVKLGTIAPPFELRDVISGRGMSRDDIFASAGDEARGLLVMFICVHCPYVKHVEAELAKISEDYEGLIAMVAIQSNDIVAYPDDGPAGMIDQAARVGFRFPYLLDEMQEVAREYDAACTPDFFLFDARMRLAYRGQLDGSRPRRGDSGNDVPVTGQDLRAAMDAVIAGKAPNPEQRTSLGCNIKWKS
ncbi:thioredoxin-related protein [Granulicella aggregans]|uniref:Thioredoxin-related protein n=1 Tax=Granulicella aggregans TaxID=474949 RepID=A0A7W7ZG89_9BACT|nr:thioredoxin family protein [Granulicella aggregans]MBB5059241.1 thioredoxin-related protein [Granulicella aggregans]